MWLQKLLAGGTLKRTYDLPVLIADPNDPTEKHGAYNPGVLRVDGIPIKFGGREVTNQFIKIYRADGHEKRTLKGAISNDCKDWEKIGTILEHEEPMVHLEDPRLTMMHESGRIFIGCVEAKYRESNDNYITSIGIYELVDGKIKRIGEVQKESDIMSDKDGVIFPRLINGRYAVLRRPWPYIKIAYSDSIEGPWVTDPRPVIAPSPEKEGIGPWEKDPELRSAYREKEHIEWVGAGTVPIYTPQGWFIIYHQGECKNNQRFYTAHAALLDLDDPTIVKWQSKGPILKPELPWEANDSGLNIVFPTAALPDADKLFVVYGAGDNKIGLAEI